MAIVEKVEKKEDKPKWEPFVTVTLSKREAAGVAALLGVSSTSLCNFDLYNQLDEAIGGTNDYSGEIYVEGDRIQGERLNTRFGKL